MFRNSNLKELVVKKLKKIGHNFFGSGSNLLETFIAPELEEVGNNFLYNNMKLKEFVVPKLRRVGDNFLFHNIDLSNLELSNLETIDDGGFLYHNMNLKKLVVPKLDEENLHRIQNMFNQTKCCIEINGELYGKKIVQAKKSRSHLMNLLKKIIKFPFVRESNLKETNENSNVRN